MAATTVPETPTRAMTWEQYHEQGRRRFAEGDAAGAEQAFRGAVAEAERPGGDPLQMASSLSSLGQLKYQQKDYAQAEDCFRRALELREQALGGDHPTVMSSINNLAALYVARGALDDAEPLLQRAMAVTVKRVEASQADLAVNLNNLVRLYVKRGDYARAEPMLSQLLALKRPLGPEHPEVAAVLVTLAKLRQSMGQPDAAERIWRRVLAVRERTLAPSDPTIATTVDGLADACGAQGRSDEELALRERSLALRESSLGGDHPSLEAARTRVADLRRKSASGETAVVAAPAPAPTNAQAQAHAHAPRVSNPGVNGAARASGNGAAPTAVGEGGALDESAPAWPGAQHRNGGGQSAAIPDVQAGRARKSGDAATTSADLSPRPVATPGGSASVRETRRSLPIPELDVNLVPTPAVSAAAVPAPQRTPAMKPDRPSSPRRPSGSKPATPAEDVAWIDPTQVVAASMTPTASAVQGVSHGDDEIRRRASAASRRPDIIRDFGHDAEVRQSGAPGRGKVLAITVAATIACAAIGVVVFGRDLFTGSSKAASSTASTSVAVSPTAPAATSTPSTPARRAAKSAPAAASSAGPASVTAGAASPATPGASPAALVPPRPMIASTLPVARPEASTASTRPKVPASLPPTAKTTAVAPVVAAVPTVNIDATTKSIDEATKAAPKPVAPAPF